MVNVLKLEHGGARKNDIGLHPEERLKSDVSLSYLVIPLAQGPIPLEIVSDVP